MGDPRHDDACPSSVGKLAVRRFWPPIFGTNSIPGFHRKMKLIQRKAYGFRSFLNYRLRVLAQCS